MKNDINIPDIPFELNVKKIILKMKSFKFFTHPDPECSGSSLPTGRQASLRAEREKWVSQNTGI